MSIRSIEDNELESMHTPIFLDTETNGYGTFRPGTQDVIQIAWIVGACTPHALFRNFYVHELATTKINPKAFQVHGVTLDFLKDHGCPFERAMELLVSDILNCKNPLLICHNTAFDIGCILHSSQKFGGDMSLRNIISSTHSMCTMVAGVQICQIQSVHRLGGYKFPKLLELCAHLGIPLDEIDVTRSHDALQDASMLRMAFEAGLKSGIFSTRILCIHEDN
jgi:DNA polymerase III epsilon subunit-like protein